MDPQLPQSQIPAPIEPVSETSLPPSATPIVSVHRRSRKGLVIGIFIILIVIGAGLAAAYMLVLKPKKPAPVPAPSQVTQVQETPKCLEVADFDAIYKEIKGTARPDGAVFNKQGSYFTQSISFNPDSIEYSSPQSLNEGMITAFTNFYKANEAEDFKITLTGNVSSTKQSELDLAGHRATKIKDALVAKGVKAEAITIETPVIVTDTTNQQALLNIAMAIDPTCTSAQQ